MSTIKPSLFVLFALCTSAICAAQKATDYLSIPGPLSFDTKSYSLNWSSHPAPNYYKHEYLVKGDVQGRYKKMILVEVVKGVSDLKAVVTAKAEELKRMKSTNPVVNYQVFDNASKGEYMIDFLVSANASDGGIDILERNVYRYKTFTDSKNNKYVLLFGVSERSYGDSEADKYLLSLKSTKQQLVNLVSQFSIPSVTVK